MFMALQVCDAATYNAIACDAAGLRRCRLVALQAHDDVVRDIVACNVAINGATTCNVAGLWRCRFVTLQLVALELATLQARVVATRGVVAQ